MKKIINLLITLLIISVFASACASGDSQTKTDDKQTKTEDKQTKTDDKKVKSDAGDDFIVNGINDEIKDFSIDGFPGGSAKIKNNDDLNSMKKIISLLKGIIAKLPEGYVMQIIGHCADYESNAVQQKVSEQRALKIYNELKKAGVPASKISYKGVGSSDPLSGVDAKSPKQRRVSFKAVKK